MFAGVGDTVEASPCDTLRLEIDGPFSAGLADEADNLVLRAARALGPGRGAALRLTKRLPVASGIGGGSADAAAALRALDALWRLDAGEDDLARIGLVLGADVPVCLAGRPVRMQGVGEVLLAAPRLPRFGLVLVNPGVALSTPAVFRARAAGFRPCAALPEAWDDAGSMAFDLARAGNDLEAAAIGLAPAIGTVLDALRAEPSVLLARMSGSGATCFGLTHDGQAAEAVAARLTRPGWWAWGGETATR